jgi:ribosomal protein S18 acetylase RimI-like enzyme
MTWRIRPAGADDIHHLALIGSATFLETFAGSLDGHGIVAHCRREHSPDAYAAHLADGAAAWLAGIEPGDAPVGYALLAKPSLPGAREDGSDLELKRIYTLARTHGTGVGRALLDTAVGEARQRGATRLLLGAYARNERALGFYTKNGFAPVGERRFRVGNAEYEDVVLALGL